MNINAAFQMKSSNASLPIKERVLVLDPQTKTTGIRPGEVSSFDIPSAGGAAGSYIDWNSSFLEINYSTSGGGTKASAGRLPLGGVNSLIQTVDIESSNFVVEHTDNWGRLRQTLADITDEEQDRTGFKAYVSGQGPGGRLGAVTTGGVNANVLGASVRYNIPVPSQQFSTGSHFPCHAVSKLRYSITWVAAKDGVVSATVDAEEVADAYQIDSPRLHLCYLEMSNKSKDIISSKAGLSWSHPLWETHRSNVVDTTASQSFRVPSHKSSVKTLLATFHDPDSSGKSGTNVDYNSRHPAGLESYQYRINGEYFPQNEVRTGTESCMEIMRAFHSVQGKTGVLSLANYPETNTNTALSTFVIGTNCESNVGRSNSSFAGISTLQESPLLLCKFGTAVASECLLYVQYDGANTIGKDGIWRVDN